MDRNKMAQDNGYLPGRTMYLVEGSKGGSGTVIDVPLKATVAEVKAAIAANRLTFGKLSADSMSISLIATGQVCSPDYVPISKFGAVFWSLFWLTVRRLDTAFSRHATATDLAKQTSLYYGTHLAVMCECNAIRLHKIKRICLSYDIAVCYNIQS